MFFSSPREFNFLLRKLVRSSFQIRAISPENENPPGLPRVG